MVVELLSHVFSGCPKLEPLTVPVLMSKIKTKIKMTRWSRNILKGKAKEVARGPMKDKYFSNATSKLYLKKFRVSFWRRKQVEVLLASGIMEERTRKLVEKDFRPKTYFLIGM